MRFFGAYEGKMTWQPTPLLFLHALSSTISKAVTNDVDGMKAFGVLATANSCGSATTPVDAMNCRIGEVVVDSGCVDVGGCAAPLRFCHHDSSNQAGAGDVWPCFGAAAIAQFFEPYRQ